MALFNFSKKNDFKQTRPQLRPLDGPLEVPKFPDLDEEEFPSYKPTVDEDTVPEIPIRRPPLLKEESSSELDRRMPLFIKINKYKSVKNNLNEIRNHLREAEKVLSKLEEMKREEDEELSLWRHNLDEIKEKLMMIDERLFEV